MEIWPPPPPPPPPSSFARFFLCLLSSFSSRSSAKNASFFNFFSSRKRQAAPSHASSQRPSMSSSTAKASPSGTCSPSASAFPCFQASQPPACPAESRVCSAPHAPASPSPSPEASDPLETSPRAGHAASPSLPTARSASYCSFAPPALHLTTPFVSCSAPLPSEPSARLEDKREARQGLHSDPHLRPQVPAIRPSRSAASFFSLLRPGKVACLAHAPHGSHTLYTLPSGGEREFHMKHLSSSSSISSRSRGNSHHMHAWMREASPRPPPHPTPLCVSLRNGVLFPLLGLGTYRLHGEECMTAVQRAVSLRQIMLIDTASVYRNEEEVGKALRDAGARGFPWQLYLRDDCEMNIRCRREASNLGVFLTSKISPKDAAGGRQRAYEAALMSMKRLGVEQLDLYLIHWPGVRGHKSSSRENRRLRHECWQALEQLYREKKVRAIGVSNFLIRHLEDLIEDGVEVVPMVNQIEFQPLCFDRELVKWGEKHGMRIQAYASLGSGDPRLLRHPTVLAIAVECGVTPALVLLRWALQHDCHIIPCSRKEAHMIEDTHVFDFCLSDEQMTLLDRLCDNTHFCWDPNIIA
ncbi:Oxidoreductase, aldo/keto reductase family,related [Neospora caninum Liverpool]|uniref:Oxidoreductase, aldo/keto reductase family,related n=1 Tax=Neospora caninum (strain Liverpool) TaxID=572307 RepID=F0VIN4_NEOCL|nr:Oxidoreductase, aldo/keto reductase family,related [Neospora caninum Liverpool]CBZ53595.1 Oxidoreductase, aldo/keto reductase family,related [Neospora caninum Liverpool]|eukprot:XP_003883627.1 Oxidoreductase, aldo/keto reductase family,related [Neospora caninum Liverpool]